MSIFHILILVARPSRDEAQAFMAQQMLELFGPKLTPHCQKCCLLCWRVLQSALYSSVAAETHDGA